MSTEFIQNGWLKNGSAIAYPYGWQQPVRTEQWVYETIIKNKLNSIYVEYICFPWATLVDLLDRGKTEQASHYIDALSLAPPKNGLIRVTACQHINIKPLLNLFRQLKINKIFWAHKTIADNYVDGISVGPLPLYPWSYASTEGVDRILDFKDRSYLVSFVGAYNDSYLTNTRDKIFNIKINNSYIKKRTEWHFEADVYDSQINDVKLSNERLNLRDSNAKEFANVIANTKISLCPSGMGPNTIRYWESLAFGCIPLVLSDSWDRPRISGRWKEMKVAEGNYESFISNINYEWNFNFKELHEGNPVLKMSELTNDWLSESVFDVFQVKNIKKIYDES